jgi:hypothetical protein
MIRFGFDYPAAIFACKAVDAVPRSAVAMAGALGYAHRAAVAPLIGDAVLYGLLQPVAPGPPTIWAMSTTGVATLAGLHATDPHFAALSI